MKRTRLPKFKNPPLPPPKKLAKEVLVVLANDPSMTGWGWVVLNSRNDILAKGCIKTEPRHKKLRIRKGDDTTRRIGEIVEALLDAIRLYEVNYLLSELPHGSQNANAATMIGMVTAIIQTISVTLDIATEWFSEGDCKKEALGKRAAVKREMIEAMDKIYNVEWTGIKYKDEAVADALAVHNVASKQSPMLKLFR